MKKYINILLGTILSLFIVTAFSSCEHKDLCYHHPHGVKIKVQFDWKKAPNADPKGMCVFFYPMDGGKARRYDFSGREGGEIEITVGRYRAIAYNNDTEAVQYSNGGFETHYLFTRKCDILEPIKMSSLEVDSISLLPEDAINDKVVITPEMVWAASSEEIEITETGTYYDHEIITGEMTGPTLKVDNSGEIVVITFTPEEVVCHYSYEYKNVKNLRNISRMSVALTGMSGIYYPGMWQLHTESVSLPFEASKKDDKNIIGNDLTFGHHFRNAQKHWLVLYAYLIDDQFCVYYTDVTPQVHNAVDPRHVHLVIESEVPIPDVDVDKGAFNPSVDDWDEENFDIRL